MDAPIPFDESQVHDRFWGDDPWDKYLPSPGFVTDFILSLRGIKSPTKFQVWSALWLISSLMKRDAELSWGPLKFYFNLYVFLVGPPAIGKTSAIDWADEHLLSINWDNYIPDGELAVLKRPRLLHSKGTAEGIFKFMLPQQKQVMSNGHMKLVKIGSELSIISGELATFLGRQQYNIGLIEKLTRLYDCAAVDDELIKGNQGDGMKTIEKPYVTLIGGITPDGLSQSIPESAFGDGFLSRVVIVYQDQITRVNCFPRNVPGGPTVEDLRKRLAWIASNAKGVYHLSKEAGAEYMRWYDSWIADMNYDPALMSKSFSRFDVHLLKVAALIRANRYEPGTTITLQDFREAKRMLEATMSDSPCATINVGADPVQRTMNQVEEFLRNKKGSDRVSILRTYSGRGMKASLLNSALCELVQAGRLEIWDTKERKGKAKQFPSSNGAEFYNLTKEAYGKEEEEVIEIF